MDSSFMVYRNYALDFVSEIERGFLIRPQLLR